MTERVCCGWTDTTRTFVRARQASLTGTEAGVGPRLGPGKAGGGGGGRASRFKRVGSSAARDSRIPASGAIASADLLRKSFTRRRLAFACHLA